MTSGARLPGIWFPIRSLFSPLALMLPPVSPSMRERERIVEDEYRHRRMYVYSLAGEGPSGEHVILGANKFCTWTDTVIESSGFILFN